MEHRTLRYIVFSLLAFGLSLQSASSQSFTKDSLQIKVYTEIDYKKHKAGNISLKKVFCDFCSDFQTEVIGEEALHRAYNERYAPENILEHGKKKLAIYIRISKLDFAGLKAKQSPKY